MFAKQMAEAMDRRADAELALLVYRFEHPGERIQRKSFYAGFEAARQVVHEGGVWRLWQLAEQ